MIFRKHLGHITFIYSSSNLLLSTRCDFRTFSQSVLIYIYIYQSIQIEIHFPCYRGAKKRCFLNRSKPKNVFRSIYLISVHNLIYIFSLEKYKNCIPRIFGQVIQLLVSSSFIQLLPFFFVSASVK